jgi:DNA-3-methyladenine glycosylase II
MNGFELPFTGEYRLDEAISFLEGWPPTAGRDRPSTELTWAACIGGEWGPVAITVRQEGRRLHGTFLGAAPAPDVAAYAARVLSTDVDATSLSNVATRDRVAGALLHRRPGLRPVCFWSPYEAAVWGILSQRTSMTHASILKRRIADTHGPEIAGLRAFPAPTDLLGLRGLPGVGGTKMQRLHHVARAALEGDLDAGSLRAGGVEESRQRLQRIPGVGPFTAELILVRGAGHPDVFPQHERRLHAIMRAAYGTPDATVAELTRIADGWRPYRSWIGFLFRSNGVASPR